MRSLKFSFVLKILEDNNLDINYYKNFLETGTYKGNTIFPISEHFDKLYTIEICEKAYNFCKKNAEIKNNEYKFLPWRFIYNNERYNI